MSPRLKKTIFVALANLIGLTLVLFSAEFLVRWRAEKGFRAALRSFSSGGSPFPELETGHWIVADPDLGFRLNPAMPGINSLGLRNAEIPASKLPGIPRVIILGDSVAEAPGGFVDVLRERLNGRAEIINAAITGYTTYQERRLLERDLLATGPDLVILQYCVNDNHRFSHRYDEQARMLFTEEVWRSLVPQSGGFLADLSRHSYLAFRLRLVLFRLQPTQSGKFPWENLPDVVVAWQDEPWKLFEEQLLAIRDHLRAINARLVVLMAPFRPQLDPNILGHDPPYVLKPQRKMAEICQAANVALIDLYPLMAGHGGAVLFGDNYHLNAAGHKVAADALFDYLLHNDLISWP